MDRESGSPQHGSLRVLFVISSLSAGGAERMVVELANALREEEGVEAGILTLTKGDKDHYQLNTGIQRISLNVIGDSRNLFQTLRNNVRRSLSIRRAIQDFAPQVVISFVDQNNVRTLAALVGSGIPVVVSERIDPRMYELGRMWNLARRIFYPTAKRLVVQTRSVADWASGVVFRSRVRTIPNFVRSLPVPRGGGERDEREILAVGRLSKQKGFDLLLEAFAMSRLHHQGCRLTILGEGPERPALEAQARRLGIRSVLSMPGVVEDPAPWMARCGVFVLPSRFEGFPNALLEAMAMGCPSIAANCPSGPADIVIPGKNGLLVPSGSVEALAEALDILMGDDEMRERLGEEAKEIRECFSRDKIVKQWLDMIREAVS